MKPPIQSTAPCPECAEPVKYVKRRARFYCDECELEFDAPSRAEEPQTIFLSYAHLSEREEDFDVSEELVLLVSSDFRWLSGCSQRYAAVSKTASSNW